MDIYTGGDDKVLVFLEVDYDIAGLVDPNLNIAPLFAIANIDLRGNGSDATATASALCRRPQRPAALPNCNRCGEVYMRNGHMIHEFSRTVYPQLLRKHSMATQLNPAAVRPV